MAECLECGTPVTPGESFCRNCGTQQPPAAAEPSLDVSTSDQQNSGDENASSEPVSLDSLGGSSTGDVPDLVKHTVKKGTTGGRQPSVKQLDPGSVLNNRYEIVRRIGGGGMGAVYVAKDRNLGDAPRAVKEMVETHLDPVQHEKAIADFKRESLLLTSLEHPSIPTVYDYFYDDNLSRFYLVMKYIAGGDLSARLRKAPGGRLEEPEVAEWGIQVADV